MRDPFASPKALRLKPVDVPGFPAPLDLRREVVGDGQADRVSLTMGRDESNDVALSGGSFPSVSSHHARFELRGPDLYVVDLGSKNGVLVGGEAIDGERLLKLGDQVRLGSVGPKFLVVGSRALDETVFVHRESVRRAGSEEVLKRVERGNRRTLRLVVLLGVVIVAAIGLVVWDSTAQRERRETRDLAYEDELRDTALQIAALEQRERERDQEYADAKAERAREIARLEASLADRTAELEATVAARSKDEQALVQRIGELERTGASRDVVAKVQRDLSDARLELGKTREELNTARRRVDLFDPVNVALARLSGVGKVRSSVVLIENRVTVVDRTRGRSLHLEGSGEGSGFTVRPNYDSLGEEFGVDSTGSGFCVDPEGWILTNAHVVASPDSRLLRDLTRPDSIEQVVTLEVVFSGDSRRHPARIHALSPGDVDLALIKIEPFEGMPSMEGFRTDVSAPLPGSDIFLFGFPLGHLAVQEGETVIASTFRGILSRNVGGQMQVDAGVHPGNSGGPITDVKGRVIGVVVSVQALPDRTAVYTIGYGIPIQEAARIWPPRISSSTGAAPVVDRGTKAAQPPASPTSTDEDR